MSNSELTQRPSTLDQRARAAVRAMPAGRTQKSSAALDLARGLGWFSIGLGVAELLATGALARWLGLRGREGLLRAHGLRGIGLGLGLLTAERASTASTWMKGRLAGDAVDVATLGAALLSPQPRSGHPLAGLVAVAGVTALDRACARALSAEADAATQTTDYSSRSGLPKKPADMRGAALADFEQPDDMRVSPRAGLLH